ncbi:Peptidase family C25 [Bacteroidales bacterium Barb6]|nr:Peptidase family C25 [Bacteroidales bacterium Barb6]
MKKIILLGLFMQPFILFSQVNQIKHRVDFGELRVSDSNVNAAYAEIAVDGLHVGADAAGLPALPAKTIRLFLPPGKDIGSIQITDSTVETVVLDKKILPYQGEIPVSSAFGGKDFIEPDHSVYNFAVPFPAEQLRAGRVSQQIADIEIRPFAYNAKSNSLSFYKSLSILVSLKDNPEAAARAPYPAACSEEYKDRQDRFLASLVVNPGDIPERSLSPKTVAVATAVAKELSYKYVVITSENLAPAFQKFVAWKKRKGIKIGVVTMEYVRKNYTGDKISSKPINDDAGKLRQFLSDAHSKGGLEYALLGGDKSNVPVRLGSSVNDPVNNTSTKHSPSGQNELDVFVSPTDWYFSDLSGDWNNDKDNWYGEPTNDKPKYEPDIYVGRLLCSTAVHVENWTEKLICYETNPGNGDYSYLQKAFYTQSDAIQYYDFAGKSKDKWKNIFTTTKVFEEKYNNERSFDSPDVPQFPTGKDVIDEFNKNYGLVNFLNHGSPCALAVGTRGDNDNNYSSTKSLIYVPGSKHPNYARTGSYSLENMNNYNYPNINYSGSCETIPFDDKGAWHENHEDNLGKYFTVMTKAGSVAYLGNTRSGWLGTYEDSPLIQLFNGFSNEIQKGNYKIGVAEANAFSHINVIGAEWQSLRYVHNLSGCPEMEMWTNTPTVFKASVTESGTSVTVSAGVSGSNICVMSSSDNGASYHELKSNVSTVTFTNVKKPYYVTVTKHNYIPFLYDSQDAYIQNQTFGSGTQTVKGQNIHAGSNVTNAKAAGNVTIQSPANVTFEAKESIFLQGGFEVKSGAEFTGKIVK